MSGGGERVWSRAGHFVPLPEDADLTPDPVLVRIRLFGSCFGGFYPILGHVHLGRERSCVFSSAVSDCFVSDAHVCRAVRINTGYEYVPVMR